MTPDQQSRLREERQGIDWSAQPSGRHIGEIYPPALGLAKRILGSFADGRRGLTQASNEDVLTALGVLIDSGELTLAGALMFCPSEDFATTVYQYRTTPGGEPKAVHRLTPPLLLSFTRAMELVEARQMLTPVSLPNGQQITVADFPSLAVREAISNAVCHRDYHLSSPITIEHSPAVFIVTSPGPLVSGVTTSNVITTTSRPRNPALARVARLLGLAEELGRGVDRMYREMIRSGRQVPRIDAEFDYVRVTLVGGAPDTNIARFIAVLPEDEQDDTDTMLVLLRLCSARTVTAPAISTILQKSPEEAEMVLRRLAEDSVGLLERTRASMRRSAAIYRFRGEALRGLGTAVVYHRRSTEEVDRKVIAHVREYGKITNRTLQNFLDVHVFKARDIISDLVHREILVRLTARARGPGIEWGPGPKFPQTKEKREKKKIPGQGSLFD